MVVGTDVVNEAYDPEFVTKFPASRLCRVFNSPSDNIKPWTAPRLANLPTTIAPHVSWKAWPDDATVEGWITSFLDTMPAYLSSAPLIPELGISMALTWYHEADRDSAGGVGATEYQRRYGVLYSAVKGHALGHLVAVVPIQTLYWTIVSNGSDVTTWWAGSDRADYCGIDCYNGVTPKTYTDPDVFLQVPFALRDYTGLPLWLPELGAARYAVDASGNPFDTTGQVRAQWITDVCKRLERGRCVAVSWWDGVGTNLDESLTDQPSIDAWAGVLANGGHDLARHPFGDTLPDYAIDTQTVGTTDNVLVAQPSATVLFYTDQTGGSQITDLSSDVNGLTPVTSVTTSDGVSDGRKPGQIPTVYGPDETYWMWASANGGPRQLITAQDLPAFASKVSELDAALQAHLANYDNPHRTGISNAADAALTTLSPGDVLTVGNDGKTWTNLAPSQVAGAILLNPPLSSGTWVGNTVSLPSGGDWASQGPSGNPWMTAQVPYSAGDQNPDFIQYKTTASGGSPVKATWLNGNCELRVQPSSAARVGTRFFEFPVAYGGPSNNRFFELSTNPVSAGSREPLLGAYGTAHSTMPGWIVATRTLAGQQGVQAGGNFNGLSAVLIAGVLTTAGPPSSGTWAPNTLVPDVNGAWWYTSAGGTPGTWVSASAAFGTFTDIASLGTNVGHGTPHAQSRTAPGSMVELAGQLSLSGSVSSGGTLATLPVGQRPAATVVFTVRFTGTGAATSTLAIDSSGVVTLAANLVTGNVFNLDGLAFVHS